MNEPKSEQQPAVWTFQDGPNPTNVVHLEINGRLPFRENWPGSKGAFRRKKSIPALVN